MPIKIILTGATGFVGEGVLQVCLEHPGISEVLMVNRRSSKFWHSKLRELIVPDFLQAQAYVEKLKGYDACFYCAGISSVGLNEERYTQITYDATIAFAKALLSVNTSLTFCFVSGSHTDSSEKGKVMWARVKGRTENALNKMAFKSNFNFRPAGMIPNKDQQNVKAFYTVIVKVLALLMPGRVSTLKAVGLAMINTVLNGYSKQILEVSDIKALARQQ